MPDDLSTLTAQERPSSSPQTGLIRSSYRRVVLKVSGESLAGEHSPVDPVRFAEVASSIKAICSANVSVTVIVGGGNIFRGGQVRWRIDGDTADAAGMTATGVNALLLTGALESVQVRTEIFSRGPCGAIGSPYSAERLCHALDHGTVAIIAGGMGVPRISTDVSAVHAAIDTEADVVIMAKHGTDGVYDSDPRANPDAVFMPTLIASDALTRGLEIMDQSALRLALGSKKMIHVVPAGDARHVQSAVEGQPIGSVIYPR